MGETTDKLLHFGYVEQLRKKNGEWIGNGIHYYGDTIKTRPLKKEEVAILLATYYVGDDNDD